MENLYDTRLECLTNSELLKFIGPETIIKNTSSEFTFLNIDELVYESRNCTMHDDILLLSESFPTEVFIARF